MEYEIGDLIDVSGWIKAMSTPPFGHMYEGVGPMAQIIGRSSALKDGIPTYLQVRIDNYEYEDTEDEETGEIDEDYHFIDRKRIELYLAVKMFEYEPSQEGDKADDI